MGSKSNSGLPQLLRERHSTRSFDAAKPITLAELAQFLDATSRILSTFEGKIEELGEESPVVSYAIKPYPGAGGAYELELYLAVDRCEGLRTRLLSLRRRRPCPGGDRRSAAGPCSLPERRRIRDGRDRGTRRS